MSEDNMRDGDTFKNRLKGEFRSEVSFKDPIESLIEDYTREMKIDELLAIDRKRAVVYEMILEKIMERGEMCVFSDPEEMNAFHQAIDRLRNRSGLSVGNMATLKYDIVSDMMNNGNGESGRIYILHSNGKDEDSELQDEGEIEGRSGADSGVFQPDDGECVKTQEFLSRKRVALERLNKIVVMKLMSSDGLELWVIYNRDSDATECVHQSKHHAAKVNFFLSLLAKRRQFMIAGEAMDVLGYFSKISDCEFLLEKDFSGVFSTVVLDEERKES